MTRRGKPSNGVEWCVGKKVVVVGLGRLVMTMGLPLAMMFSRSVGYPAHALQVSAASDQVEHLVDGEVMEDGGESDRPWFQELPSGSEFVPLTPRSQPILRLRHGPYFPDLEVLEPPAPEPLWPTIVQPIRLVIRLSERRVYVYQGDEIQTSYPIAVGRSGWETPTGTYKVLDMQENPAWKNPFTGSIIPAGRNNPLGDRWIGFWSDGNNVIGFHGTPNEGSVGRAASHGCIRMFNQDVRALYTIAEVGMPVIVEP